MVLACESKLLSDCCPCWYVYSKLIKQFRVCLGSLVPHILGTMIVQKIEFQIADSFISDNCRKC